MVATLSIVVSSALAALCVGVASQSAINRSGAIARTVGGGTTRDRRLRRSLGLPITGNRITQRDEGTPLDPARACGRPIDPGGPQGSRVTLRRLTGDRIAPGSWRERRLSPGFQAGSFQAADVSPRPDVGPRHAARRAEHRVDPHRPARGSPHGRAEACAGEQSNDCPRPANRPYS